MLDHRMPVPPWRLNLLRAMYALIAFGLAATFWPLIVAPPEILSDVRTAVRALLGGLALVSLLGLVHPLKMLPLLIFELVWKLVWVLAFGWPAYAAGRLDAYGSETLMACLMGVVLVPLVLPWRHVWDTYLAGSGEPWRR